MNRLDLEGRGFVGWIPLVSAREHPDLPHQPGVYAVSYDLNRPSSWPEASCGGWHKGRDPAVSLDRLEREWVEGTDILYIGKTDRALALRIREFAQFGNGEAVPHWGGRLVWQVPDVRRLKIGWLSQSLASPAREESRLLTEFVNIFGQLPFANLRRQH